jgi:hypothetical protein
LLQIRTEFSLYVPYLYGRQEEALALAELATDIAAHPWVVPLIEPVVPTPQLHTKLTILRGAKGQAMLIANPTRGELASPSAQATALAHLAPDLADAERIRPVFRETDGQGLVAFLSTYVNRRVGIILTTQRIAPAVLEATLRGRDYLLMFDTGVSAMGYLPHIPANRGIDLGDRFRGRERNVEFAHPTDEFFSNDLTAWKAAGRAGFSDRTVLAPTYRTGGGAAVAIAVHLTYMNDSGLRVRHYVSDVGDRGETSPKWAALLGDLVADVTTNPTLFEDTDGLASFLEQARTASYTSPGASKRQQIVHHIETVARRMTV